MRKEEMREKEKETRSDANNHLVRHNKMKEKK